MAGRFKIPSLDDTHDSTQESFKPESLFAAHRSQLKANIEAGKKTTTTTSSSNASAASSNVSQQPAAVIVTTSGTTGSSVKPAAATTAQSTSQSSATISTTTSNISATTTTTTTTKRPPPPWLAKKQTDNSQSSTVGKETETVVKPTMMYKPVTVIKAADPADKTSTTQTATLPGSPIKSSKASLLVSRRQRGNPLLKHIRAVPWEYDDIVADYQMGRTTCALFLSLRYHQLNPNYIHERLKQLGHTYDLRVMLVQVDIKDPHHSLKELARVCILSDCTLILAFSVEEAGRYLETYKSFEAKPPDLIMEKTQGTFLSKFSDCLTSVKKVNKTDAMTLLSTFQTFEGIVSASDEDLSLCPGFGPQKAQRLHAVLKEPFVRQQKRRINIEESSSSSPTKKSS